MLKALFKKATFTLSAPNHRILPEDNGAEVAFVGRSNAGKSSTLNALCGQNIAKTSKTPDRTQTINVFSLNEHQRLIDLPGYGFAKTSLAMRHSWDQMITEYLEKRQSLKGLVIITDVRHDLKPSDLAMIDWSNQHQIPHLVLLNKADKISNNKQLSSLSRCQIQWPHSLFLLSSAQHKTGINDLMHQCYQWLSDST